MDGLSTSESDVYKRQILTSKVGHRAERVNQAYTQEERKLVYFYDVNLILFSKLQTARSATNYFPCSKNVIQSY